MIPTDIFDAELGPSFDVICLSQVLEHMNDPTGMLRRVKQFMSIGGSVIHIDVPNHYSLAGLPIEDFSRFRLPLRLYSMALSLQQLFKK